LRNAAMAGLASKAGRPWNPTSRFIVSGWRRPTGGGACHRLADVPCQFRDADRRAVSLGTATPPAGYICVRICLRGPLGDAVGEKDLVGATAAAATAKTRNPDTRRAGRGRGAARALGAGSSAG